MQAQLIANDIACRRGERLLFKGLSLGCAPGDALQVTGSNGVGKSSLIRILAGLLKPFSGEVSTTGAMGLIDETLALDANQPLGKALAFWERIDGCRDPSRALEVLQLEELLDVPVRFLSTGQKKRAAFARLLNRNCPIWLLDEPLNGLDTQAQKSVESLVALHCSGGGIAVVASHQAMALPDAETLAIEDFAA
ncbi:heme ABC exporter ATP-binding protein CcmA [Qipengyuania sp. 1NDW9]|uniref:Heme ABC exporter ATP-binding protein CcmA n=1 Tax=Qipengyuania xiapuensis TaxID=2867236 RepID=A0ABX8ZT55_9SPHN|nr:heme ABC exporter ATP-binding protein CcmA [Qipengyuania xiapuensis]MBX7493725.1 heme ABC exporter ATP-binding protein CcmA [Qipengyuania xiapuensis]QZD92170.1 heme ABC exporter ATP-binding protein CcmA [Qipengyuania xiapuensis]